MVTEMDEIRRYEYEIFCHKEAPVIFYRALIAEHKPNVPQVK